MPNTMPQHPERFLRPARTLEDLEAHLTYSIANAIWAEIESYKGEWTPGMQPLVDQLSNLAKGGPKGQASPDVLNLYHWIGNLTQDVSAIILSLDDARKRELERARKRLHSYPEPEFNPNTDSNC